MPGPFEVNLTRATSSAIEVDERAVVDATCQNGKITTQGGDIQPSLTLERGEVGHVMTLNIAWEGSISYWPVACL